MTFSVRASQTPARHSLAWSVVLAVGIALLLFIALRAPERAPDFELLRPTPRPPLLDLPVISSATTGAKSPQH